MDPYNQYNQTGQPNDQQNVQQTGQQTGQPIGQQIGQQIVKKCNEFIYFEYDEYKISHKFFLNCIIQIIFFIGMLIILFEFIFFDKIKEKLTKDVIENINFYIQNLDLNKININNKYFDSDMIKNLDYDKIISIINENNTIFTDINIDINYIYLILGLLLLLLIFVILYVMMNHNINIGDIISLISQNIIIFFFIFMFEYYVLDRIVKNYNFINNNNYNNNNIYKKIKDIIVSYSLI